MSLLLIDNYDSFTFNLFQLVQAQTDWRVNVVRNDAITFESILQQQAEGNLHGIILSPGPGHPKNRRDFGVCMDILSRYDELSCPLLGVCLGHQGIVQHFGGEVTRAPFIVHGKTSEISVLETSPLWNGVQEPFQAMRYHSLVADEATFPHAQLKITARDNTHQLIMAVEHHSKPIYGVQFHPESIGTPDGSRVLQNFITLCEKAAQQHATTVNA